jgi:hypothetical protein
MLSRTAAALAALLVFGQSALAASNNRITHHGRAVRHAPPPTAFARPDATPSHAVKPFTANSETEMRMIVLLVSLFALAAPAHAAQQTHPKHESQSLEQKCRAMVGKETVEGEGRSHMGQMQAQRFSDCMMGTPN